MAKLYPTETQQEQLEETLSNCRDLYNKALKERINRFKKNKTLVSLNDQIRFLTKNKTKSQSKTYAHVLYHILKHVDRLFFKQVVIPARNGEKIKFPQIKTKKEFNSFCYPSGCKLTDNQKYLFLGKIGKIQIKESEKIVGKIKSCYIFVENNLWYASIKTSKSNKLDENEFKKYIKKCLQDYQDHQLYKDLILFNLGDLGLNEIDDLKQELNIKCTKLLRTMKQYPDYPTEYFKKVYGRVVKQFSNSYLKQKKMKYMEPEKLDKKQFTRHLSEDDLIWNLDNNTSPYKDAEENSSLYYKFDCLKCLSKSEIRFLIMKIAMIPTQQNKLYKMNRQEINFNLKTELSENAMIKKWQRIKKKIKNHNKDKFKWLNY